MLMILHISSCSLPCKESCLYIRHFIFKFFWPYFRNGPSINSKEFREYHTRKMLEPFADQQDQDQGVITN